jgi:lipid-A-disaccharide synthase-like uncharacterized protein
MPPSADLSAHGASALGNDRSEIYRAGLCLAGAARKSPAPRLVRFLKTTARRRLIRATMDWLMHLLWYDGKFLGIEWHFWKVVGWTGNVLFTSRFFVQWWATERQGRVVIPSAFWWLSLAGSGCLLIYGFYQRDSVFIFAYLFTWIPYIRNLMIGRRARLKSSMCSRCAARGEDAAIYCTNCGVKLTDQPT